MPNMLIEQDAQARYVAATLAVLNSELRTVSLPAEIRGSIFGLLQRAQERAEDLAVALRSADAACPSSPRLTVFAGFSTNNVIPFARRA
jgi:hypothetical protein